MPSHEQFGFRCEAISQRHRLYGSDVPALDLDFALIEYDRAEPVALFEHKFWRGGLRIDLDQPSLKAFASLGSRAALPAFVAQYNVSTWQYRIYPANEEAKKFVTRVRWLTEREYAALLYQLRGKTAPADILMGLMGDPFEEDEDALPILEPAVAEKCVLAVNDAPRDEWEWDWDENDVPSVG